MRELIAESNIEEVAIKNEKGEILHILRIDKGDTDTPIRFGALIDNLENIAKEVEGETKKLEEKYSNSSDEFNRVIEEAIIHVKYLKIIISEIDALFGADTIRNIFAESYELNEDFVPDEYCLMDFIEKIMPIMSELFGERYKIKNKKYNVSRKGKHNMSKEDLIKSYMGKA